MGLQGKRVEWKAKGTGKRGGRREGEGDSGRNTPVTFPSLPPASRPVLRKEVFSTKSLIDQGNHCGRLEGSASSDRSRLREKRGQAYLELSRRTAVGRLYSPYSSPPGASGRPSLPWPLSSALVRPCGLATV